MSDEQATGFFVDSSNPNRETKMSGEKPSTVTPLTIRQLMGYKKTNEKIHVDGKELFHVEVLGQVMNKNRKNNYTSFLVDDCTASIEVKVFDETVKTNEFLKEEVEKVRYVYL